MPIPSVYVTRFFQLITARQFAEAERVLQRLRQRIQTTEWNRGYFQALYGMLLSQKSNDDRYAFLLNINLNSKEELQNQRREFLKHARSRLHADYDRGYFSAWADYTRILSKLELPIPTTTSKNQTPNATRVEAEEKVGKEPESKTKRVRRKEKIETRNEESEKPETIEKAEIAETRQSTLFDFSM